MAMKIQFFFCYSFCVLINFSIENICCRDSKKFSAVDNKTQEMITGQLIDINMDFNESSTPVNFNNNSLLTSTNLVTSDSPESKGKIFFFIFDFVS